MHKKALEIATDLRAKAKVEYVDAEIKKQIEEQAKGGGHAGLPGLAPPVPLPAPAPDKK